MKDRIHELLQRNLQEVFGEGDATRRGAAIEELYTEDCVLYVPPGKFVGHDALDKFAGDPLGYSFQVMLARDRPGCHLIDVYRRPHVRFVRAVSC
jgi:hypothetical protein